jgi:adenylate kinase family enzyme
VAFSSRAGNKRIFKRMKPTHILFLGAPGSGKSLLGQVLQTRGRNVAFFSVGNQLRKTGLLDEHDRADTVAKRKGIMERMRKEARAMVEKEIVCMAY